MFNNLGQHRNQFIFLEKWFFSPKSKGSFIYFLLFQVWLYQTVSILQKQWSPLILVVHPLYSKTSKTEVIYHTRHRMFHVIKWKRTCFWKITDIKCSRRACIFIVHIMNETYIEEENHWNGRLTNCYKW